MPPSHRSFENLYLVGSFLLFLVLPFQNCSLNPIDLTWSNENPGYRVILDSKPQESSKKVKSSDVASSQASLGNTVRK